MLLLFDCTLQTDAKTAMKSAKAKYSFMGQDLARVSVTARS